MEKITIRSPNNKLTDPDISAFEIKYNLALPGNFKDFIKKYNGGLVAGSEEIKLFKSLKYGTRLIEESIKNFQVDEKLLAADLLPIAEDFSGNPIVLNLTNGQIGVVYLDSGEQDPSYFINSLEELLGVKSMDDL